MKENTNNNTENIQKVKSKKWITVALEVIRIIIAALSGGVGASVL